MPNDSDFVVRNAIVAAGWSQAGPTSSHDICHN